jgi:cytochrome P450
MTESEPTLDSYNPFDPAVQEDPWHYYALLRREAPVYKDPHTGLFMVSSYELVTDVLKNWEVFSNRFGIAMGGSGDGANPFEGAATAEEAEEEVRQGGLSRPLMPVDTMLTADPPEQKRYRSLVDRAFRLKRVRSLEPRMRALAGELIDRFIDRGRVELRSEFAMPVPMTIIAEQLGVGADDLEMFHKWSDGFVAQLGGMASAEEQAKAQELIFEFQRYFANIVVDRRENPQDDIISDMVNATLEGERPLDMPECLSILQQLLVAGNETTASTICEGMRLFAEHPDQWKAVREDPALIPNAVEEILRHATPTSNMWRVTKQDTVLGGVEIPQGSMVMIRYAAANRDEQVFPEPDRFDIERENANVQIAFGLGIHYCLGAQLAKSELAKSIEVLSERLATVRIAPDALPLRHTPNILLRGLESLPLEFEVA